MAIYLHDKYAKKIQAAFSTESFITGRLSEDYDFSGAKTVKVATPITVPMVDYKREGTSRYGDPVEMQDTVQAYYEVLYRADPAAIGGSIPYDSLYYLP